MAGGSGKGTALRVPTVLVFWCINDNEDRMSSGGQTWTGSQLYNERGRNLCSGSLVPAPGSILHATALLKLYPKKLELKKVYFLGHGAPGAFIFWYRGGYANNSKDDVLIDPNTLQGYANVHGDKYRTFVKTLADRLDPSTNPKDPNVVGFLSCFTGDGTLIQWVYDTLKSKKDKKTGNTKFPHLVVGGYENYYQVWGRVRGRKIIYFMDRITKKNYNTGQYDIVGQALTRDGIPPYEVKGS